jgi:Mg2+ and Co2+ transporter CorA
VPGQDSVEGFWLVIGVMIVTLVAMLAVFRRRGWL